MSRQCRGGGWKRARRHPGASWDGERACGSANHLLHPLEVGRNPLLPDASLLVGVWAWREALCEQTEPWLIIQSGLGHG
jgi:hypothetical protein